MDNLFSIFDPSTSFYFSLNWMSLLLPLFMIPYSLYIFQGRVSVMITILMFYISGDLKNNLKSYLQVNLIIFSGLFFLVMLNNLMGLFPYIFTSTSHLIITVGLCLPFWLALMMKSLIMDTFYLFSHLVPNGAPFLLAPFMVIIESVSLMIRPITLSVRLSANMIAGHLLIVLLSNLMSSSLMLYIFSLLPMLIMLVLELSVAFIQAYVFIVLLSLYLNETSY